MLKSTEALRKNLLRVKQLADQGLGRAEKSEVLSEDLINAEKRVECLKQICSTTTKKLQALMQTSGGGTGDSDKKLKKVPGNIIGAAFEENAGVLCEGILHDICAQCAQGHYTIGKHVVEYERQTEADLLDYLQGLLDVDIPALQKTKKNLSKLTLDMDSARTRYTASQKQTAVAAKTDSLKEELDDASLRVDQCKDQYATEVYTFIAKEPEICAKLVEWLEAEVLLHEKTAATLTELVPKLKDNISRYSLKPLFGTALEEHLHTSDREIALVIETCIETLAQIAMDEEGLFRIAGSASKVKKLVAAFNAGAAVDMADYVTDVHAIAGALKQYLRELPEPLLTFALNNNWLSTVQIKDHDQRMRHLWTTVQKLPKDNFSNLRYLIKFLAKLAENAEVNKMSTNNLSIVIGPNLLWAQEDAGPNVLSASIQSVIVEILITHHAYFFPGEAEFDCKISNTESEKAVSEKAVSEAAHARKEYVPNTETLTLAPVALPNDVNVGNSTLPVTSETIDSRTSPRISRAPSTRKHAPPIPARLEATGLSATPPRPVSTAVQSRPIGRPPAVPPPSSASQPTSAVTGSPPTSPAASHPPLGPTAPAKALQQQQLLLQQQQGPRAAGPNVPRTDLGPPPLPPPSRTSQELPPASTAPTAGGGSPPSAFRAGHVRAPSAGDRPSLPPQSAAGHRRTPSGEQSRLPASTDATASSRAQQQPPPPVPEKRASRSSTANAAADGGLQQQHQQQPSAEAGDVQQQQPPPQASDWIARPTERANSINDQTLL